MSSQLGIHPVQNLPRYACPAQSRFWIISSSLCNDFALNYKPELCTYLTFKRMVCSGCLKFSERFKPALCTYIFLKQWVVLVAENFQNQRIAGFSFLKEKRKSESENRRFWIFQKHLQNQQFSWKNWQRTGGWEGSFLNFSKMAILYENWFFLFSQPLSGKWVIGRLITDQYLP